MSHRTIVSCDLCQIDLADGRENVRVTVQLAKRQYLPVDLDLCPGCADRDLTVARAKAMIEAGHA